MGLLEELTERLNKRRKEMDEIAEREDVLWQEMTELTTAIDALEKEAELELEADEQARGALTPAPVVEGVGGVSQEDAPAEIDLDTDETDDDFKRRIDEALARGCANQPAPLNAFEEQETRAGLPEGFTGWPGKYEGFATPPLTSEQTVVCWMGGDDFIGPLEVRDVDWNHVSDPVRGFRVAKQGELERTLSTPDYQPFSGDEGDGSTGKPVSGAGPQSQNLSASVEDSEALTQSNAAIAQTAAEVDEPAQQVAPDLPPLFPPEPPPAATPEQLIEAGAINGEAYGLWRKLAKVEA